MSEKYVLVRSRLGTLYVLQRKEWEVFNAHYRQVGEAESKLVLESEDYDELRRFRDLTKEET